MLARAFIRGNVGKSLSDKANYVQRDRSCFAHKINKILMKGEKELWQLRLASTVLDVLGV